MKAPLLVAAAIVALGVLYVLVPVVIEVFLRFRARRMLRCPQTGTDAEVQLDARKAALTSAFGPEKTQVQDCSLWPEKEGCQQDCVKVS
ncbi:MAG: hypothetical protein HYY65_08730 [Candidatus Tectomicrobia bacterium]|uniref:Uncharacterized protein n=1 Tax=Tectimicrobiota bacterium TaxID=2528274 RepID=A0A932GQI3_UNCTE|nr:hypothetical protein [Candidatus Tectomicrobia bacterium]